VTDRSRILTGILLIAVPVLFNLFFFQLQSSFDYPSILRQPPDAVLTRFAAGGSSLIGLWYGFAMVPALFIPAAVLLRRAFPETTPLLDLATPFAIVAGVVQLLGLVRWPFLVPELARSYLDPAASDASRAAALTVFSAFHQYAGVAVGEHLGYLFTGAWTLLIAAAMLTSPVFRTWWGWLGLVSAVGILIGLLEPAGVAIAGTINAFAYIAWSIWLIGTGVFLLRAGSAFAAGQVPAAAVSRSARAGRR
jgi:hypothetical protein